MGEKRTESLLALGVSGVLVFSLTASLLLRFGVSRLPALHSRVSQKNITFWVRKFFPFSYVPGVPI
jgi:hypothetical protein